MAGFGCAPLENRREGDAQAGGASRKANGLSAASFSPFGAAGLRIPAGAHEAQTMPARTAVTRLRAWPQAVGYWRLPRQREPPA